MVTGTVHRRGPRSRGQRRRLRRAARCGRATWAAWDVRKLQFGTVWINTHIPLTPEMPHGGYKQSGYGKDMSIYSIEEYTNVKHVMASLD